MLKYEYYILNDSFLSAAEMEETFNDLGKDGWCYVGESVDELWVFRRPIDPEGENA